MKQSLGFPLFLIIVGALWFLKSVNLFPNTANIIAFALIFTGVLVFLFDGFNKQSIVSAPVLMYIGVSIYATNEWSWETTPLIAMGMIISGCLMLIARSDSIPAKQSRHFPPKK